MVISRSEDYEGDAIGRNAGKIPVFGLLKLCSN
jgi:hypothetical protein